MVKKILLVLSLALGLMHTAFATGLLQVYQDALFNDPTFKSSEAEYLAAKENVPIARSALLPSLILSGSSQRQHFVNSGTAFGGGQTGDNTLHDYLLSLSQPIFNYSSWYKLKTASYQAKQAEATFAAAAQDLMIRTASAYFGILQANDTLRFTRANKEAVAEQLKQTQDQYDVGLVAITGVKEAQANYDALVAQEIAAKDSLANSIELLRTITGKTYPYLKGADTNLPLVKPTPDNIELWVKQSECQNYSLLATVNATNAAQQNIEVQRGGHFPVVDAIGSYEYTKQTNSGLTGFGTTKVTSGGVSLNFPIYQGGLVNAQTQQAQYQYQQSISEMEFTHRQVIQQTRDGYLGVITGISKVNADRQAVESSQVSLKATQEGYEVGTRTILDVLRVESDLYQAQQTYSQDRYNYLNSILTLKEAAGTLSPSDLVEMNTWLTADINIASQVTGLDTYRIAGMPSPIKYAQLASLRIKKAAPINSSTAAAKKSVKKSVHAKKSIAAKNSYYSIALFDTRYQSHAQNFIDGHQLQQQASYVASKNAKGESRYQVIYGNYATLRDAETALKKLPKSLQALHPWIKKIK